MEAFTQFLWAIAPSLTVALVMALFNSRQKQRESESARKETERVKGEELRLDLLLATAQLSYAVTMALKRGSTNGEVEPAVEQYNKAMVKFRKFEREQIAKSAFD